MKLVLALFAAVWTASSAAGQIPVGALAIDERQGARFGWAVDYETSSAAETRALAECGSGCSVVLTFERCAAYAADQDAGSTVYGWAESSDSADGARQRALTECGTRGSGCTVRVWGCMVRWSRLAWASTVQRVVKCRRGSRPQASIPAVRTKGGQR